MTIHTLEQQLAAICEVNNLTAVSIQLIFRKDGTQFLTAYAHAEDDERRFCGSTDGYDETTVIAAINSAIGQLNEKRVPELSPMGEAA